MKIISADQKYIRTSRRAFYMALAFVLLSMVPGLFISNAKAFAYIAPLVYIFIERKKMDALGKK